MIARHAEHPVSGLQIRKRPQIAAMHGHRPVHEISDNHDDVRIQGVRALHNLPNALLPCNAVHMQIRQHGDRQSVRLLRQAVHGNRFLLHLGHSGASNHAHSCQHGGKNQQSNIHPVANDAEPFRPVPPQAEQNQQIQRPHHIRRQQQEKEQEKNGEQPRGRQQNVFRQNRGEKHGASKQMQQVEFECRHRQQGGKQKLPAPFQLQRQNSAAKNVNRQQCSENQNHMSLS